MVPARVGVVLAVVMVSIGPPPPVPFMPDSDPFDQAARLLHLARQPLVDRFQLVQTGEFDWFVLFLDGGSFRIEWSGTWARLVLVGVLCTPTAPNERRALNLALSYNALWREVGNLRMARATQAEPLVLIGEFDCQHATPEGVGSVLLHFEGLRRRWGEILSSDAESLPQALPSSIAPLGRV